MSSNGTCQDMSFQDVRIPRFFLICAMIAVTAIMVMYTRCSIHRETLKSKAKTKSIDSLPLSSQIPRHLALTKAPAHVRFAHRIQVACMEIQSSEWCKKRVVLLFLWAVIVMVFVHHSGIMYRSSYDVASIDDGTSRRLVYSTTTTPSRIANTKSMLEALVNQSPVAFDAIYLVIPRVFRGEQVEIPTWLFSAEESEVSVEFGSQEYNSWKFVVVRSTFHESIHLVIIERDFGPSSKILGTLLVEHDDETILVYGDDDREYSPQLASRALHYFHKYPGEVLGTEGGWIGSENALYCGRSLEIGVNRVSVLGGAGGVVTQRKFFDDSVFQVVDLPKSCYLGDDLYLSNYFATRNIPRRLIFDSCWNMDTAVQSEGNSDGALSGKESTHYGGANVENYQSCITTIGDSVARDVEFGYMFSATFSKLWGIIRIVLGKDHVPC